MNVGGGNGISIDFSDYWARREEDRAAQVKTVSMRELQNQFDRLTLVTMAMWSLLKEKTELTEEDLLKRVEEIDLSDGKIDGKFNPQTSTCPQCGRTLSARHNRCLYCGYVPPTGDFAAFIMTTPPPMDDQDKTSI